MGEVRTRLCTPCQLVASLDTDDATLLEDLLISSSSAAAIARALREEFPDRTRGLSASTIRAAKRSDYACCADRNTRARARQ